MNEKVEVQIGTRRLVIDMEGRTPIEINALAQKVSERVGELQSQNNKVADTSKIALLAALSFADELDKERFAHEMTRRLLENKAETLSEALRESLRAGGYPETAGR
ncbi:MAG: cell division protein ZapA [Elusimicrobiota bacterium]